MGNPRRIAPLIALGAAAGIFTIGVVSVANAHDESYSSNAPRWAHKQILQDDAIAYWNANIGDRLADGAKGLKAPIQSPGILRVDYSEEGPDHEAYYEVGLVENLLDRYTRCASLQQAQEFGTKDLNRVAESQRSLFSESRGVAGIMDTDEYFAAIDRGASAEGISPADYELKYMCDVLEVEGK